MHPPRLEIIVALSLVFASEPLLGLPEDRNQPIHLEADRAQLDQQTGVSVYEGNVVITQGSMRLTADTVTVRQQNGTFQRMEAVGKPANLYYRPQPDKDEIHGVSQRVDYDVTTSLVVMTTNARLTQGQDEFTGDRIEYDLKEDLVKARGTKEGGRIRFTLQPKPNQPNPPSQPKNKN